MIPNRMKAEHVVGDQSIKSPQRPLRGVVLRRSVKSFDIGAAGGLGGRSARQTPEEAYLFPNTDRPDLLNGMQIHLGGVPS